MRLLEHYDGMSGIRNAVRSIAEHLGEYAGIPLPLDDECLEVEPTFSKAMALMNIGKREQPKREISIRNTFWSFRWRSYIHVYEQHAGKVGWMLTPGVNHFELDLRTLGCADAWGVEQESNAIHSLADLLNHRQFKNYMLTGMFLETSKRSGVAYMFRRLKPTVAICMHANPVTIMCTLCLHPIAYYRGSWAGAMAPTDDVIAHLTLMRGDEPMFWRRANQHAPYLPEAGL